MRTTRTFVVASALLLAWTTLAAAQEPALTFQDLSRLVRQNDQVRVVDSDGRETAGRLDSVSPSSLVIRTEGRRREWGQGSVATVHVRRSDPPWNGMLWGLAIGGALSILPAGACENNFGCHGGHGEFFLLMGGVGAGVGAGVDALIRANQIVYRASSRTSLHVAPLVTPSTKGAALTVAWK